MRRFLSCHQCALIAAVLIATSHIATANRLTNGDFEDGLNGWIFTGDGVNEIASLSSDTPTGVGSSYDIDVNQVAGLAWLQQDVAVTPGQELEFSVWGKEVESGDPDGWIAAQVWMLPDSGSGLILNSAALFFWSIPTADWGQQSTNITVPAGATVARVLFTPQNPSFLAGTGQYRIDDVVLRVPEPAAISLAMIVSSCLWFRRRRRTA